MTPLGVASAPVLVAATGLCLAVLGAVTLNNQGPHTLAMVGLAVSAVAIALLVLLPGSAARDALALVLVSAAVLLGTALRSWFVIGHDIQREYFFFQIARNLGFWDIATYSDPYNACLSVTLLPAGIQAMTGLSDFVVFKVMLPLAFVPAAAAVYAIARRVAPRRAAVLASVFFVAFPTFVIDMAYLLRQGVAFMFLAGFVMLLSDDSPDRVVQKRALAITMGVGVVLSHYSTTYVLALTLIFAGAARLVFRLVRSRVGTPRIHDPYPVRGLVLLHPVVVLTVTAMAVTWSGAITQTGGHLRGVLGQTLSAVVTGEAAPAASELRRALFAPPVSAQEKLDDYSAERYDATQSSRIAGGYLDVTQSERFPRVAEIEPIPPTPLGEALTSSEAGLEQLTDRLRLSSGLVLQLLTAIGLLLLVFRPRRLGRVPDDLRWLCVGSAAAVLLFIVGPGLSAEYGFLRSLQQSLFAWAALAAATLVAFTRRWPRVSHALVAVVAVTSFLNITGWSSRALGGYEPQLNLANAGFYDRLYNYDQADVAGMQWALDFARYHKTEVLDSPLVWTDRSNTADFMANLAGPPFSEDDLAFGELYPSTIPVDALIYLPSLVSQEGISSKFVGGDIISYEFPVEILDRSDAHLLYNNGYSRVYR